MKSGMKAWVAQRDKKTRGKEAPWVVFWSEPGGRRKEKSCGPGKKGWRLARRERDRLHGELVTGTYVETADEANKTWAEFRALFTELYLDGKLPKTVAAYNQGLAQFEKHIKPTSMKGITGSTIDRFVARRRKDRGKKPGSVVSPSTVNRDLRHIRAALNMAHEWGFLENPIKFRLLKADKEDPRYMTEEHFKAIYNSCKVAERPGNAEDWWRALVMTLYMTGWRISETLALRWENVDLKAGTALLRARTTKGRRDATVRLHSTVVDHLARIKAAHPFVFSWPHHERALYTEFHRIQKAAGIHLPCDGEHECTDSCHYYGFHGERYAFATMNAGRLSSYALQTLMRHSCHATTERYINYAKQVDGDVVDQLHVPETALGGR